MHTHMHTHFHILTRLLPSPSYNADPFEAEVCVVSKSTPLHLLMSDTQSCTSAFAWHAKVTCESAKEIMNSILPSTATTDVTVFNSITIDGAVASSSFRYNSSLLGPAMDSL